MLCLSVFSASAADKQLQNAAVPISLTKIFTKYFSWTQWSIPERIMKEKLNLHPSMFSHIYCQSIHAKFTTNKTTDDKFRLTSNLISLIFNVVFYLEIFHI